MEFERGRGRMGREGEGRWGVEEEGRRKRRVRDVERFQKESAILDEQVRQMELRFEWLYLLGPLKEGGTSSDDDEENNFHTVIALIARRRDEGTHYRKKSKANVNPNTTRRTALIPHNR
jgi:hypothetical protein